MKRFLKVLLYLLPLIPAIGILVLIGTRAGESSYRKEMGMETSDLTGNGVNPGEMLLETNQYGTPEEVVYPVPVFASSKEWEGSIETGDAETEEPGSDTASPEKITENTEAVSSEAAEEEPAAPYEDGFDDGEAPTPAGEFLLCIDPGHYGGANPVTGGSSYGYAEGDVTLKLAFALQRILWESYGIDSYLTRETEHITIDGLSDKVLDTSKIALRGACASLYQSDLFISLHTNANANNANGYPTFEQPASINKPMIIVNEYALSSEQALRCARYIGEELASVYERHDLPGSVFLEETGEKPAEWTGKYNDGLNRPGMVVWRMGTPKEGSDDYYGVLRGSANEGISGMIIEHGFHSVPEIRRLAMEENLIEEWALADAAGIARGLGL